MARKPSERANRQNDANALDLTPLMDIITNLMFFLLLFANVIPVAMISAPLPKVASTAEEVRKAKATDANLDVIVRISGDGFRVEPDFAAAKYLALVDGKHPFENLHLYLVGLHSRKPKAKEITLIPSDEVKYDTIIKTMDASRELVEGDPGYEVIPPEIAKTEEAKNYNRLFPNVSIGGI